MAKQKTLGLHVNIQLTPEEVEQRGLVHTQLGVPGPAADAHLWRLGLVHVLTEMRPKKPAAKEPPKEPPARTPAKDKEAQR